jgi:hypothetical protein
MNTPLRKPGAATDGSIRRENPVEYRARLLAP